MSIPDEIHTQLKLNAAQRGMSLKSYITYVLSAAVLGGL